MYLLRALSGKPQFHSRAHSEPAPRLFTCIGLFTSQGVTVSHSLHPQSTDSFHLGWGLVGTWGLFESELSLHLKLEIWGGLERVGFSLSTLWWIEELRCDFPILTLPRFKIAGGNHLSGVYRHESRLGWSSCRGVMRNSNSGKTPLDLTGQRGNFPAEISGPCCCWNVLIPPVPILVCSA